MNYAKALHLLSIVILTLGFGPTAHAKDNDKILVEIITEIRPNDAQAGVKSHQTITIDPAKETATTAFETGKTNLGVAEISSIRDSFTLTQKTFQGNLIHITAKGETGSGIGVLGSIDYQLTLHINKAQSKVWIAGTHNKYPSYTVKINGKVVYDRRQTGIPLTGLVDALNTVNVGVEEVSF